VTKKVPYEGVYCDTRMGGVPKHYLNCKPANADMRIPDEYLESVCFLCVKFSGPDDEEIIEFVGTGFLVSVPTRFTTMRIICLVTAKHIILKARAAGHSDLHLRMNLDDGQSITWKLPDDWHYSNDPAIDVAAMFIPVVPGIQSKSISLENFATDQVIQQESIGIGDDVFAIGLFTKRHGDHRNTPIMRTGIIASMPNEQLESYNPVDSGYEGTFNAYLVELRSIGGISGSPVFVNLDFWRLGPNTFESFIEVGGLTIRRKMFLLGMIRAHWNLDRENAAHDYIAAANEDEEIDRLNTGIAIVTPIQDVLSVIDGEEMMKIRKNAEDDYGRRFQPTYDSVTPPCSPEKGSE
jgi:hypothetical protein